jgi:hypothetical protein
MSAFSTSFLRPGNTPSTPATSNPQPTLPSLTLTPATPSGQQSTTPSSQSQQPAPQQAISSTTPFMPPPPAATTGMFSYTSPSSGSSGATLRLREIAQQSQKLNETIRAGSAELPKLDLSLGMIREKARDMSRRAGGVGRENMQQAYPSLTLKIPKKIVISYLLHLD